MRSSSIVFPAAIAALSICSLLATGADDSPPAADSSAPPTTMASSEMNPPLDPNSAADRFIAAIDTDPRFTLPRNKVKFSKGYPKEPANIQANDDARDKQWK